MAKKWTGNRGERERMACNKGNGVESNCTMDTASVHGSPALPTVIHVVSVGHVISMVPIHWSTMQLSDTATQVMEK